MHFTKMQGAGNDYVYVDGSRENVQNPEELARKISDRHFGVGSDGLVLILPGDGNSYDFQMRMFNADGSEAEMCGNASRCIGKYVYERGLTDRTEIRLKTGGGIKILRLRIQDGRVDSVTVDMGIPKAGIDKIEVDGKVIDIVRVDVGNPHCVLFVEDADQYEVEKWGRKIEVHPAFPDRTNTEFVTVKSRNRLRMRVWERGSGETMACGTGACASLAAAVLRGLSDRKAYLELNGGTLEIEWMEEDEHLMMSGPAEFVFEGDWE